MAPTRWVTARFTSCTQRVGGLHNFQLFYAVFAGANALRLLAQKKRLKSPTGDFNPFLELAKLCQWNTMRVYKCKYRCVMATINIRLNDDLKERSYAALEKLGITPSELLRQTLEYVAQREKLPFKSVLLTSEDEALIAVAKARLADPKTGVKVSLDDL